MPISAHAARFFFLCLLLSLAGWAKGAEPHHYRVTVDEAMTRLSVEARFSSAVDTVGATAANAGDFLLHAGGCSGRDAGSGITLRKHRMLLPPEGLGCLRYTVDLQAAGKSAGLRLAEHNTVISAGLWLWRPAVHDRSDIVVQFELPETLQAAIGWQRSSGAVARYLVPASPERAEAPLVLGHFVHREIEVPGATLQISIVSGQEVVENRINDEAITRWLRATATDVSLAYGRFPVPSPHIVVIPVEGDPESGRSPVVPLSRITRDGQEVIELFVDRRHSLPSLVEDSTATREFSRLMLPHLERQHRWVSEGFARYYQSLLQTRAGGDDPLAAWQTLHDGLEKGRLSRPELSPNEVSARNTTDGRLKIDWSGAALALMADVTLRQHSGGALTLDTVMGRLQSCCLPSDKTWSGPELFTTLDSLAGSAVFMPLYRRYADTAGFPDTRPLFARLGLVVSDRTLATKRGAELQHIRSAIMEWENRAVASRDVRPPSRPATEPRPLGSTAGSR